MVVWIISFFSVMIICQTVGSLIKVFRIAVEREEITIAKHKMLVRRSILIGAVLAVSLPFGYDKLYESLFKWM
ncbi:hypothetical protein [Bacillus sp. KH172YL63]|uniref:hypothetical protein n=1 Tax=Bacillus sp. KH172YL63 TaxID=2709784 RepID=UPI0013E49AC6|nr:hypothetical protein [Bacillus sp. KH172YL63]BCB04221.1 hypothetical protein KH172YL63_23540 [Bacillus sp. KH172YL63]